MHVIQRRKFSCCGRFVLIITVACVVLTLRMAAFVTFQYYPVIDRKPDKCYTRTNVSKETAYQVTKRIHQIFFNITDKTIPTRLVQAQRTWQLYNPDFQVTLWNKSMVDELINKNYPDLKDLYHSYGHWVRKADVARLAILDTHGGIYADLDVKCAQPMNSLLVKIPDYVGVAVYQTKPFGVSNDFIIAKRGHRFLRHLLCGLPAANHDYLFPYITTMMSTGPGYVTSRLSSYDNPEEVMVIDSSVMSSYLRHISGASWHQWDGKIVWWTYVHVYQIAQVALPIFFIVILLSVSYTLIRCVRRSEVKNKQAHFTCRFWKYC